MHRGCAGDRPDGVTTEPAGAVAVGQPSDPCAGFDGQVLPPPGDHPRDRGNDHLVGTPDRDVIVALGGDDVVERLDGADLVCAGAGNDSVRAPNGVWKVDLGSGDDRVLTPRGRP